MYSVNIKNAQKNIMNLFFVLTIEINYSSGNLEVNLLENFSAPIKPKPPNIIHIILSDKCSDTSKLKNKLAKKEINKQANAKKVSILLLDKDPSTSDSASLVFLFTGQYYFPTNK